MKTVLGDKKAILIFLGPALLVYTLIMLVPIFWSIGYTMFTGNTVNGFHYNGFKNFSEFLHDPAAWQALWFTAKYAVVLTVGQIVCGYGLALIYVFWLRRAGGIVRTLVFFPVVLPTVAVALLFQRLFQSVPTQGPVNGLIQALGGHPIDWFGHASTAFWVLIIMDIWRSMGFYAVLLFTGLLDIPDDIIESARLDGASGWSLVRNLILPLSLPILLSSIIFSINGTLKVFDSVIALTNGGPGNTTTPMTLFMYNTAFTYGDYGYGSTIALMLTIVCLLVTVFVFRSARRDLTKG